MSDDAASNEMNGSMDEEPAKAIIRLLIGPCFNDRRLDLLDELIAADFDGHPLTYFPDLAGGGAAGVREGYERFFAVLPDARVEIVELVAEGERVVMLNRFSGTPIDGGDAVDQTVVHFYGVRNGRVVSDRIVSMPSPRSSAGS